MRTEKNRGNSCLMASVTSVKLAAGLLVQCEVIGSSGGVWNGP